MTKTTNNTNISILHINKLYKIPKCIESMRNPASRSSKTNYNQILGHVADQNIKSLYEKQVVWISTDHSGKQFNRCNYRSNFLQFA